MKKAIRLRKDELRPEYRREDLGKGVRGKFHRAYTKATNLVLLSPDIAAAFPTPEAVNDALHSLLKVAKSSARITRRSTGAAKAAR